MNNVTIQEDFILPSKGKVYNTPFNPEVKLRSMTVAEEMKRLTASEDQFRTMADIIEDCLETKLPISVYDMCLGDYQYLLHKLRIVTYGSDYKLVIRCPLCGEIFEWPINLDELKVSEYDDEVEKLKFVKLPITGKTVELRFQTPRDLDFIERRKKEMKKQFPEMKADPTLMLNIETLINTIDGQPINRVTASNFIKKLPMKDVNLILHSYEKLQNKVGIDINLVAQCPECKYDVKTTFRFTNEFFRPQVN